jgi:2,4-dienoyl-CoA reductase-like NADH-dependent reductase (Old Yellow Enzyme family)
MGMYSGQDGHVSDFHIMHLGGFAFRGPGLTIAEVTAVLPTARTSPIDAGLWDDSHIEGWKRVVDFVHGLEGECKIGIQLGHSGRKGSMTPIYPGTKTKVVSKEEGGWEDEVWGASSVPFLPNYITPKEMSQTQINTVVSAFGDAADRAVRAGFGKNLA